MKINGYPQKPVQRSPKLLIGAHFSISGGYHQAVAEAVRLGCPVFQIFTKNASTWRERKVRRAESDLFRQACRQAEIRFVASHAGYLINPASGDAVKWKKSCRALAKEVERAAALGLQALVLHPGSHMGSGVEAGIRRTVSCLAAVVEKAVESDVYLLLETTAGQGNCLGHRFEHLAAIIDGLGKPSNVGVCLDTCHVFAAGYDLRTEIALQKTLEAFDRSIGLERLKLLHLNDSLKPLGARVDRHVHIGRGHIGDQGFTILMNHPLLAHLPGIIETPKSTAGRDWDLVNLEKLRTMAHAGATA